MATYDRYTQFRQDGKIKVVPFGKVTQITSRHTGGAGQGLILSHTTIIMIVGMLGL